MQTPLIRNKFGEYETDCQGTPTLPGSVARGSGHYFRPVAGSTRPADPGYAYGTEQERCSRCKATREVYWRDRTHG